MTRPSLHGFLNSLKMRTKMKVKGEGIVSKTRLFIWVILNSIPRTAFLFLSFVKNPIELIKNRLARKIIVNVNGSKFRCVDSESIFIVSPEFESWMWNHLNPKGGDVFLDVGAHIGKYTIQVAKIVGENGLVIAVEPHPENYEALVENIKLNNLKNVIALKIAAWSKHCKLKMFIGDKHGHHSIKKDFGLDFVTVQAEALDDVLYELKVEKVNYIKIDVEGAELDVLKGLVKTLREHHPTVIVEIEGKNLMSVKEFMYRQEYNLEQIAEEYYRCIA